MVVSRLSLPQTSHIYIYGVVCLWLRQNVLRRNGAAPNGPAPKRMRQNGGAKLSCFEKIRGKLESYRRAFKRFESVARRIMNYSRFTDQEGRAATRNFWRLGGGRYSREAVQGVAGWFGIRNMGVSGRGKLLSWFLVGQ